MPSKQSQKPRGRVKSSIVLRLNLRLFLRLLGIYVFMDLLLLLLTGGGVLLWADRQCADVSALVEERGVPSAEATVWMAAGDYTVSALTEPPDRAGFLLNGAYFNLGSLRDDPLSGSLRTLDLGAAPFFFGPWTSHPGRDVTYTVALPNNGEPYAITLDLEHQITLAVFAGRVLLICQLVSLLCNLFKNAGTIRRTLKPIQELAAAATRLGNASSMSPEELSALAGRLDEINATHLDKRIPVSGTQKELKTLAQAINAMVEAAAPIAEEITGGKANLKVLSNYAIYRLARARVCIKKEDLGGEENVDKFVSAYAFAAADPFRAATNNKGVMNGMIPVVVATGNDTRAVESGVHSYAARNGRYSTITIWEKNNNGDLEGMIEVPMAVGTVGGTTKFHPAAQVSLKMMGITKADDLEKVIVSVGLAANLGVLYSLVTVGLHGDFESARK